MIDRQDALDLAEGSDLASLMARAAKIRDAAYDGRITYSRKPGFRWSRDFRGAWVVFNSQAEFVGPGRAILSIRPSTVGSLPCIPIPVGFAVNSALGAAAWSALFFGLPAARAMTRRIRHRCWSCGYPSGTSNVCSECGKSLRQPSVV